MKNLRMRWLGLVILFAVVTGFAQSPPPIPIEWFWFPPSFETAYGNPPLAYSTNLISTDMDGSGIYSDLLILDTTNLTPAFLSYNYQDTSPWLHRNFMYSSGAVLFYFAPNWASVSQGGTGPGQTAFFVGGGDWSSNSPNGLFAIYADAGGSNIYFGGVEAGDAELYASAPISWGSNTFHQVGVEWTTGDCEIYLDGALVATGDGIIYPPKRSTWTNGFFVGSDYMGYEQARGAFCDMITWNQEPGGSYTNGWLWMSNALANWQDSLGGGGGFGRMMGMSAGFGYIAGVTYTTNYLDYTNFWITIGTASSATQAVVTIQNTQSNLTYSILTNSVLDANLADWGIWQTLTATNSVVVAPNFNIGSNALFFASQLALITGTNQIADWWQMLYFKQLGIDPYADPDGDGLCNYSEYVLGTNPTDAYSISATHNDAQAVFLAYTNDASTRLRLFLTNGPGTTNVTLTLSNTLVGSNYQIYSKDLSATNNPWRVETSFLSTNNATRVVITVGGRTLAFIGGDGEDPDGDGLPSGYEVLATHSDPLLADTGNTGVPDGYKDPDGDGFNNLQEYYNGTDPLVFNTPAAPAGLSVVLNNGGGNESATLTWDSAGCPVSNYVIFRDTGSGFAPIATNSWMITSFTDNALPNNGTANYEIQAMYGLWGSQISGSVSAFSNPAYNFPIAIVNGPSNRLYLVVSAMPAGVTNFLVTRTVFDNSSGLDACYPIDFWRWNQMPYCIPPPTSNGTFSMPLALFTNGVALIPASQAPPFGSYDLTVQATGTDRKCGSSVDCWGPSVSPMFHTFGAVPFLDGTSEMKNNVAFLLAYGDAPFECETLSTNNNGYSSGYHGNWYASPEIPYAYDYVYSSYFTEHGAYDQFLPFEDNCAYSNFLYSADLGTTKYPSPIPNGNLDGWLSSDTATLFATYSYVTSSGPAMLTPSLVMSNNPWLFLFQDGWDGPNPAIGIYQSGATLYMTNGATNFYGLPYLSFQGWTGNYPVNPFALLSPTSPVSAANFGYQECAYSSVQTPALHTIGFYFARLAQFDSSGGDGYGDYAPGPAYYYPTTVADPMPGNADQASFDITNTTAPLVITSVGQPMYIAGYAKQVATNGASNVFAYLGQYFTNALLMHNGAITTTNAGIVSEYGSFFPTLPGQIALMTKPDPDQGNLQGQCTINVIRLSLDVNHDGTMDESFTGPDNTTADRPFAFWDNNNYDRWNTDWAIFGSAAYQDDVATNESAARSLYTGLPAPDYDYRDTNGHRMIPCTRDLEDFTRLWVSGVSNTLSRLPAGSTVTLSWAGNGTSPSIDLFQAADADGGMGYLTNEITASNQINTNLCKYMGRLGSGGSIQLNASTFSNGWAGDHYIWCGVWFGSDQLNLTVSDGDGKPLAQSSQWIYIQDIKQMYERWTVGDNDDNQPMSEAAPMTNAVAVANGFSPGSPTQAFTYAYNPAFDTNDDYILYVHGWNEPVWRKDRWADTAYKRLYWQGYQGRFGSFRWPSFHVTADLSAYDTSEWNAWKTGQSLEAFLANTLNRNYPNHVYLLAHSQGNVVAGEALRLATNQIVTTYVASQAAMSARAYDNTISTNVLSYYSITTSDPQGNYYTNGAPSYFSASAGAGTYVNFYNPVDYALMGSTVIPFHPGWLSDQSLKPDEGENYVYAAPSASNPSGYALCAKPLSFATNTYEIFAMCAQSYSLALGAQAGVGKAFRANAQVNLNASPYGFGSAHIQHDAQFVSDNMTTAVYWQQLLLSFGLKNP